MESEVKCIDYGPLQPSEARFTGRSDRTAQSSIDCDDLDNLILEGIEVPPRLVVALYAALQTESYAGDRSGWHSIVDRVDWASLTLDVEYDLDPDFETEVLESSISWYETIDGHRTHHSFPVSHCALVERCVERDVETIQ